MEDLIRFFESPELAANFAAVVAFFNAHGNPIFAVALLLLLALIWRTTQQNRKYLERAVQHLNTQMGLNEENAAADAANAAANAVNAAAAAIKENNRAHSQEQRDAWAAFDEKIDQLGVYTHDQFAAVQKGLGDGAQSGLDDSDGGGGLCGLILTQAQALQDLATRVSADGDAARQENERFRGQLDAQARLLRDLAEKMSTTTTKQGSAAADLRAKFDEQTRLLQETLNGASRMVSESVGHLTQSVDAKMELLADKIGGRVHSQIGGLSGAIEQNISASLAQTMDNVKALESRIGEALGANQNANQQFDALGKEVASLSKILLARSANLPHHSLSELLTAALSDEMYEMNAAIGEQTAAAILRAPGRQGGGIAVDAGFDADDYMRRILQSDDNAQARAQARQELSAALQRHIGAVAAQFISPPQTGDLALLFVASETAFAEIAAHHRAAVDFALARRVWLVSPTTLLAVLNMTRNLFHGYRAGEQLAAMRAMLSDVLNEARAFESRLMEINDYMSGAARSVQRAEYAGAQLRGRVQHMLDDAPPNLDEPQRES